MNRPRTISTTAGSNTAGSDSFSTLINKPLRDRAVENVYFDKLPVARPSSAPFSCPNTQTYREVRAGCGNDIQLVDQNRSTGTSGRKELSKSVRCARSLILPGAAMRISTQPPTPPPGCEPPVDRSLKPKIYQRSFNSTVTVTSAVKTTNNLSSPPVPSPHPLDVSVRLEGSNDSNLPSSVPTTNPSPIVSQPQSNLNEETNQGDKKLVIVEVKESGFGVTTWCESDAKKTTKLRNDRRYSLDPDHALIEINESKCKPGEHEYACPRCGKCMCSHCKWHGVNSNLRQPLKCGGRCLCNADSVIDAMTCFCCVRACFYHCSNQEINEVFPVKPCSCRESHCCARWTAIGALTIVLPCILCYPVAKGCAYLCKACNRCAKPGCQCKESNR